MGSRLAVSDGAPSIDMVYKLAAFDGRPVLKLSADKATLPGPKQVWRRIEDGRFAGDVVALADEGPPEGHERRIQRLDDRARRPAHRAGSIHGNERARVAVLRRVVREMRRVVRRGPQLKQALRPRAAALGPVRPEQVTGPGHGLKTRIFPNDPA